MAKEFERIFLENDVYEWQAKDFWQKFDQKVLNTFRRPDRQRAYVYSAIKTLTTLQYLVAKPSMHNHRVFLYTSTPRLKELCNKTPCGDVKHILNFEKNNLINELSVIKTQISVISEMFYKHIHLKKQLVIIKKELNNEKQKLDNKLNAIILLLKK